MLRPLEKWDPASHEYMAFGHEIGATSVQMARAVSVIANGGVLVQPRLILSMERPNPDGSAAPLPVPGVAPRRVIKPETAFQMRLILRQVVEEGTGKQARLAGYSAGGKTGSAELFDFKAHKWTNRHNASFIGFAPVTNPRVVVVVTLNGSRQLGGVAAAPVFRDVTQTALRILHAPKDVPEQLAKSRPAPEARPASVLAGRPQPAASGRYLFGPQAPDFTGKPVAAVLRESVAREIPVETIGQGLARTQWPAPGTVLEPGARVIVEFSR
jgi:cell division protein FtsI (penicillin-binding protein 3)